MVCVKQRLLLCLVQGELQRLAFGFLSSQRYSYETGVTCSLLSSSPLPNPKEPQLNMKSAWKARCAAPTPPCDNISWLTSGHKAQLLSLSFSCCVPHVGTLTGEIPAPAAALSPQLLLLEQMWGLGSTSGREWSKEPLGAGAWGKPQDHRSLSVLHLALYLAMGCFTAEYFRANILAETANAMANPRIAPLAWCRAAA